MPRRGGTGFSFGNQGKQRAPDCRQANADTRSEIANESDGSLSAGNKLISPEKQESDFKHTLIPFDCFTFLMQLRSPKYSCRVNVVP